MKIFLDDIRNPPSDSWKLVRTAQEAIEALKTGKVEWISLDHDLGENQPTGYDVVKWIEKEVFTNNFTPPRILIHSMNTVGVDNIKAARERIEEQAYMNKFVEDVNADETIQDL